MEEIVLELAPAPLLVGGEVRDGDADPGELLGRGEPVLRQRRDAGAHLPDEARDADHEELVEVVGRDRQEAQLLEQRMVAVLGLLEDAAVELEPGQLAVDEALRRLAQRRAVACRLCDRLGRALDGRLLERLDVRFPAPLSRAPLRFSFSPTALSPAFYDSFATVG